MGQYVFGQVSERTKTVRSLMGCVTGLGDMENPDPVSIRNVYEKIAHASLDVDDVFLTAAEKLLGEIVKDGQVSDSERALLKGFIAMYDDPISSDPVSGIAGRTFVLTGDFENGGKDAVSRLVKDMGGKVTATVSSKTSYVVVGNLGSGAWAYGALGGKKIKKALDLRLTGKSKVEIVSENALFECIDNSSSEARELFEERSALLARQWDSAAAVSGDFCGLTSGQKEAFDLVKAGHNVCLLGLGGTGKSFITRRIIEWAENEERNVLVCAPTGIAALNVGGCTVHRALGIKPHATLKADPDPWISDDSPILACDLMIVDEISMCRMDLFDYLSLTLMKAGRLRKDRGKPRSQLVVVGDFFQLPPVVTVADREMLENKYGYDVGNGYPFLGEMWDQWEFVQVELTEAIRQRDASFVAALNACRYGDTRGLRWIEERAAKTPGTRAVVLCGRNDEAERENKIRLEELPEDSHIYEGTIEGEVERADLITAQFLELKNGARVMVLVNEPGRGYMNGSLGNILSCRNDSVEVLLDEGKTVSIKPHKWEITRPSVSNGKTSMETIGTFEQIPLKLAYAITMHKAQGQTFEEATIYPICWDPGQLYTALSRVTCIEGLHLAHHCPDASLIASRDVLAFVEGRLQGRKTKAEKLSACEDPISGSSLVRLPDDACSLNLEGAKSSEKSRDRDKPTMVFKEEGGNKTSSSPHSWTTEEEAFVLANPQMSAQEIADKIGVTKKAVERKRAKLRTLCQQ